MLLFGAAPWFSLLLLQLLLLLCLLLLLLLLIVSLLFCFFIRALRWLLVTKAQQAQAPAASSTERQVVQELFFNTLPWLWPLAYRLPTKCGS